MRYLVLISALFCAACASSTKDREPASQIEELSGPPNFIVPDAEACQLLKKPGYYLFVPDRPQFRMVYLKKAVVTRIQRYATPSCGQSTVWMSATAPLIDGKNTTGDITLMAMFPPSNDVAAGLRVGDKVNFLYQFDNVSITSNLKP